MSFRLVIHEEAYRELDEAERYIEARRSGMAASSVLRWMPASGS